jgi:hypothetical protein
MKPAYHLPEPPELDTNFHQSSHSNNTILWYYRFREFKNNLHLKV